MLRGAVRRRTSLAARRGLCPLALPARYSRCPPAFFAAVIHPGCARPSPSRCCTVPGLRLSCFQYAQSWLGDAAGFGPLTAQSVETATRLALLTQMPVHLRRLALPAIPSAGGCLL